MPWRTSVFDRAQKEGWSLTRLAHTMGLAHSTLSRVRANLIEPGNDFRTGAMRAFPDAAEQDLVWWEEAPSEVPA